MPKWTRAGEIILGLVSLIAGIFVIAYPGIAVLTLIVLLSIGLIFLGWRYVIIGAVGRMLPTWLRAANIGLGILTFILAVVVIASPGIAALTLVLILYIGLFLYGIAAISLGASANMTPTSWRAASIAVGALSVVLALVFLVVPGIAIGTWILLLAIGLFITGVEAIATGAIGRQIVPLIDALRR